MAGCWLSLGAAADCTLEHNMWYLMDKVKPIIRDFQLSYLVSKFLWNCNSQRKASLASTNCRGICFKAFLSEGFSFAC